MSIFPPRNFLMTLMTHDIRDISGHSKKYKIFFCLIIREPQWRGGIFAVDSELGRILEGNTAFLAQREAVSPTARGRNAEIGKKGPWRELSRLKD